MRYGLKGKARIRPRDYWGGSNYIFVHFCTCTFGKNLMAMYINVQKIGNPWKRIEKCPKRV